jgi:hypothetical protein
LWNLENPKNYCWNFLGSVGFALPPSKLNPIAIVESGESGKLPLEFFRVWQIRLATVKIKLNCGF